MKKKFNILIDGLNIKSGGGLVHLKSILENEIFLNSNYNFKIISSKKTLKELPKKYEKINFKVFEKSTLSLLIWRILFYKSFVKKHNIDLIFCPGGWLVNYKGIKTIVMCQNFILFDDKIINKYFISFNYFKFKVLRYLHMKSLNNSSANIFLSKYVSNYVNRLISNDNFKIIPHGVGDYFNNINKKNLTLNINKPINIVYTSYIDFYKMQYEVIEEILFLRKLNYNINLFLVGNYNENYFKLINKKIIKYDFIFHINYLSHMDLFNLYNKMNIAIFSSTCENLPITILEYMRSNMPIISHDIPQCKEVLGDAAIYFNIYQKNDLSKKIEFLINNFSIREKLTKKSYNKSLKYNWDSCAINTFKFIENSILN